MLLNELVRLIVQLDDGNLFDRVIVVRASVVSATVMGTIPDDHTSLEDDNSRTPGAFVDLNEARESAPSVRRATWVSHVP